MEKVLKWVSVLLVAGCLFAGCKSDGESFSRKHYEDIMVGQTQFDELLESLGEHDYDSKLKDGRGAITWTSKDKERSIYVVFEKGVAVQKHAVGLDEKRYG